MADQWHFSRPELAERTLQGLTHGPSKALTLFAPRRTGKTEFLLKDLKPLAEKKGHIVIYASFWKQPLAPLAVLIEAFEKALETKSVGAKAQTALKRITPKVKLSGTVPGTNLKGEVDLTQLPDQHEHGLLLHLDALLGKLERKAKKTILLLDEVQELAKDDANYPLVAALRTSLDTRSDGLRAIFTGSSRDGLKEMFSDREAPFFHFAAQIGLEPLDEAFVDHMCRVFKQTTKRALDRTAAVAAFNELHQSPFFFRGLIEEMVLQPALSLTDGLEAYRSRLAERLGYTPLWRSLKPLQRAVLITMARGNSKPFAKSTLEELGEELGTPPKTHAVQTTLRSLARADILDRWAGEWQFADPEFASWILRLDQST